MRIRRPKVPTSVIGTALMTLATLAAAPAAARAQTGLFKDARQSLAVARARGDSHVVLLIAARTGSTEAVVRQAEALGGEVRYRHDGVAYLRVRVPIDRATTLARQADVEAVTVDVTERDPFRPLAPIPHLPAADTVPWPPRWSDYPLTNPYLAIRDIDGAGFQEEHPTFDGRGVTIALLDGSFDFLLPEFQTAYTLEGKAVPKLADYLTATHPVDDADEIPQWVDMKAEVEARGGRVSFGGKEFATPGDGRYRIGFFDERRFNRHALYLDQDVDRNGNPRGDDGLFGVLWDEASATVWVDADRDLSFSDERGMADYVERGDLGVFGTDDPDTQIRESVGFAVQTDPEHRAVAILVGIFQHATEIMGHVVGNPDPEGRLRGVAPGARLASVYYGVSNAHGLIEGLIAAFEHPSTDLVVLEQSVAIASIPYLLADGRHPISVIAQRLIDRHQKLLFVPGSNSPGLGIVAEDGLAPGAVSVGGYQHKDSYLVNNGFEPEPEDNMHWGGLSHGPSGIGAKKPDLLAPSGQMSVDIGYVYRQFEQELRGLYQLPAGYFVDGGTSTATPMAAGAAALVVSAAKQTGVPYTARSLKRALTGSARFIPRLMAHEQGSGVVQVAAAYTLLDSLSSAPIIDVESRAPVRTRLSHLLTPADSGVGLYERGGWTVGDRGTRPVILTRTSGPPGAMSFAVSWEGNDGTFQSADHVVLPLGEAVDLPVRVRIDSAGAHSALLVLRHPDVPGPVHEMLATVVAPLRPDASNHTLRTEFVLPRPGDRGVFIDVPPGTAALRFSATAADGSDVWLSAITPGRSQTYPCRVDADAGEPCTVADPEPGVWEINATARQMIREFDPNRPRPVPPAKVSLEATLIGFDIDIDPAAMPALRAGQSVDIAVRLANRLGAADAALANMPLASARTARARIGQGEQHVYRIDVPEGAGLIQARVDPVSDDRVDLDVYLFDCTAQKKPEPPAPEEKAEGNKSPPAPPPPCSPAAVAATVDAGAVAQARDPAPGRWVVVVDGYWAPEAGTAYAYLDVFTDPRLGAVTTTDLEAPRDLAAQWNATAHVWVAAQPGPGRELRVPLVVLGEELQTGDRHPVPLGMRMLPY